MKGSKKKKILFFISGWRLPGCMLDGHFCEYFLGQHFGNGE
jgi:hypothetical protein